jgi:glycosyltransferase involved in cell wall biosynthesis
VFTRGGARPHRRWWLPLRYLADAAATWRALRRLRPAVVIATTPAVFAPMAAWTWCARGSARLVIDCHTGAFTDPRWARSRPLHRLLFAHADVVLVHTEADLALLSEWRVRTLLLPDDVPGEGEAGQPPETGPRPRVLVAGSFDQTEPVAAALAAAALLPEYEFRFTGDIGRLSRGLRRSPAANVRLTGFLDYPRFLGEMRAADLVAVFSEETNTMSRAAFEAVGLGRALVLSDQPGLRSRFGEAAVFSANRPGEMASAIREAHGRRPELEARSRRLRSRLQRQRETALGELRAYLARPTAVACSPVLVVSGYPFPDHVVLRNVKTLLAAGARVDVICPWKSNFTDFARERRPGLRVFRLPVFHKRSHPAWYLLEYTTLLVLGLPLVSLLGLARRYRAVDVYNVTDFAVFTALVPRLRGARVVLNMLEMNPELTATRLRLRAGHPLHRLATFIERLAVGWADRVVTVSETWRRILVRRGADAGRIVVVPNTQQVASGAPAQETEPRLVLVSHGVQIPRYGLEVAIRALPRLVARYPGLRLELIGDGEDQAALRRLTVELGVDGCVDFVGFIPRWEDAIARVSRAAIGLVPVLEDGYGDLILPTRLIDYAALGVPAVCSRLAAIQEYFPEDAVSYFTPGDADALARAVEALLHDPDRGLRQASRARAALAPIAWEAVSDRYLAALGFEAADALPATA